MECWCCLLVWLPQNPKPALQVRTASCGAANCVNTFGDEQLAVDLLADKLLFEALKFSVGSRCPYGHEQ